jgi:hypothetical protein
LALLELPRWLTSTELAAGFGPPRAVELPRWIEESFQRQLAPPPSETRWLLLIAAAEPAGDPGLVHRAARQLGVRIEDAAPAVTIGMVDFGAQVRFRHPLVRSAIYRAATGDERRHAHSVLAQATDSETEPDRRAWHRAQAAAAPDDDVADDLERCAGRAEARGGLGATGAFLQRATELTVEPQRKVIRALAAARAVHAAGSTDAALLLLSVAEVCPADTYSARGSTCCADRSRSRCPAAAKRLR